MIRAFSLASLVMVATIVYAAPAFGERRGAASLKKTTDNIKIIGSISRKVDGKSVGIVVLKDKVTAKTQAVQIGQVFTVNNKALRIIKQNGKDLVFSDGNEIVSVTFNNGVPSDHRTVWRNPERQYSRKAVANNDAGDRESEVYAGEETREEEPTGFEQLEQSTENGVTSSLKRIQQEVAEIELAEDEESDTAMAPSDIEE